MSDEAVLPVSPSKPDLVYDLLRTRILDGVLRPGDRLSMDKLAREFGISKIPIREAMSRLETQGFITSRQHAGPVVSAVDAEQLKGAYLARAELEPLIARLATAAATSEALTKLTQVQDHMRSALTRGALGELANLNYQFHIALAELSGYTILMEISQSLLMAVRRYRVVDPLSTDNWRHVVEEHDDVLTAMATGDPQAAGEAAHRHAVSQAGHDRVSEERVGKRESFSSRAEAHDPDITTTSGRAPASIRGETVPRFAPHQLANGALPTEVRIPWRQRNTPVIEM